MLPFDVTNVGFTRLSEVNCVVWGNNGSVVKEVGNVCPLSLGGRTTYIALGNVKDYITDNVWYKYASVYPKYEGFSRYSYDCVDGIIRLQYNRGTTKFKGNAKTNSEMDVNFCNSVSYTGARFYAKNLMMFDKALDTQTIKEIQNIV